jgi:hypothetical protein
MVNTLRGLFLMVILLALSACGSSGSSTPTPPPPPPPPAAPKIDIFAKAVSNCGANLDDGLQFFVQTNENLQLISVDISHQFAGSIGRFNLNNQLAITGQQFAIQDANVCFLKVTGEYRFVFTVTRPNDPTVYTVNTVYTQASALRK